MTQVAENIFSKGFCENFFNLFDGINWVHDDCSIPNKTSKVMILDYNMIFPWRKYFLLLVSSAYGMVILFRNALLIYYYYS